MSQIGRFIVVFKANVSSAQIDQYAYEVEQAGGHVLERFDHGSKILNGFSATIPDSFQAQLAGDTLVDYIGMSLTADTQCNPDPH
ncbi:hypothetical protein D9611_012841 [Ephemerocybe angulata]|uniref:Inhibitor I9 domain-containing protein n=1 Tax=Ephemerocybe angulata TaxID=980116 RepID=A0A8H5BCS1_9AGAR|nr:hypothetical protein D9611_012841 [Tulosesus angulatus]